MASDSSTTRFLGLPLGAAFGLVGLVVALATVGLLWKSQIEGLGGIGKKEGVNAGGPLQVLDATKVTATVLKLKDVGGRLESWRMEHGGYPPDMQTVRGGLGNPPDGWGAVMEYTPIKPGSKDEDGVQLYGSYQLVSRGQDGLSGTQDDIVFENGFVKGAMPDMIGTPGGQVASSGPSKEAQDSQGMVDPESNSSVAPAGMRALEQARGIASKPRGGGEGSGD